MTREDVRTALHREPFVPLRIRLADSRHFDVPFKEVAHFLGYGVLVFIGLKEGTHQAKSYDRFAIEQIVSIDPLPMRRMVKKRRKAS